VFLLLLAKIITDVVKKYAVYERLMKCKYDIGVGGLVMTGQPDRATRNL